MVVGTVLTSLGAGKNVLDRAAKVSGYFFDSRWSHGADPFLVLGIVIAQSAILVGILVIARMVFRRDWAAWSALAVFSVVLNTSDPSKSPVWLLLLFAILSSLNQNPEFVNSTMQASPINPQRLGRE